MNTKKAVILRPFQKEVRDLMMRGKNVILQAPTGSGKTLAALSAYTDNLASKENTALPLSCIYATPLRVLSTQFHKEYKELIGYIDREQATDYGRHYQQLGLSPVSIQTGEQPDDPQFESLITFCTIDQLLASFLATPFSVGRSRANLNVAAVLGAQLVLDEYHLYPLKEDESCFGARTTVLAMLSLLRDITPFVLMTATLSKTLLEELGTLLNAEVVTISDEKELEKIADGRQRFFALADTFMTPEAIQSHHDQCSLVICNTVLRAQQRYWELRELTWQSETEIILLHSRLSDEDREQRSKDIMRELGPDNWHEGVYSGKNLIVVSTQVVEVGLDISVQTLHSEIAPASSLIQRAGRCARFAKQQGRVIIYDLPVKTEGKPVSSRPYDAKLCENTIVALKALDLSRPVGFSEEQDLIDAVHAEEDKLLLERFYKRRTYIQERIFKSLKDSSSTTAELIRDVVQVQILIHNDPKNAIKEKPWEWQSFSLHPGSLASHIQQAEEQREASGLELICREAVASKADLENPEADSRQTIQYDWPGIPWISNFKARERKLREAIMIAVPQQLATYHPELGLIFRDDWPSLEEWPDYQSSWRPQYRPKRDYKPYKQQSYQQHISGLVAAYNTDITKRIAYSVDKLEKLLAYPAGSIDHAIRLAIACHDLGKLSVKWQAWAWEWQTLLYERKGWPSYRQDLAFFFAKTDFDSRDPDQREWQKHTQNKRPNHACESVAIGLALIVHSLGITAADTTRMPLLRAVSGAIARHHTPTADDYASVTLKQGALGAIQEALELARQNRSWTCDPYIIKIKPLKEGKLLPENGGNRLLTVPQPGELQALETWLYFVIVRALRLCDQRADNFGER